MSLETFLPEFCRKEILVLGCGNRLFGDDGFGGEVIDCLHARYPIPDHAYVMDAGTGVRKLLFTLSLTSAGPRRLILVDAVDKGRRPGEIFEIALEDLPIEKSDDFSLHQAPSSNLARDLIGAGLCVRVLACQIGQIPASVEPGLSEPVAMAVPRMAAWIARDFLARPPHDADATWALQHPP